MLRAPLIEDLDRRVETRTHRCLAVTTRLEPDGKSHRLLDDIAVEPGDLLGAGLDPERSFGQAGDDVQWLFAQHALKPVGGVLCAVGDHADMKVVADAVRLGAIGDDGIERLVEHVRQEGGLALSAVQAMIHRRRLIHHHQDRRRRGAADFGLVTQGPYPCRWPQPAARDNRDLRARAAAAIVATPSPKRAEQRVIGAAVPFDRGHFYFCTGRPHDPRRRHGGISVMNQ